ncbi:MAG: hypothetical protein V2I57_07660 [Xanthomonadales bacterium]|jgi:hypothetical protein|nr:hypothetical protein [Xanthomonadales bacterium]
MKSTSCLALAIAAALLLARPAAAQPAPDGWFWTVDGLFAAQGAADLGDEGGDFSLQRAYLGASLDYLWDPRTALGVSVGGGLSRYDFSGQTGLAPGEPWEDIEDWRVSLASRFPINDRISGLIIPSYRVNRESGASTSGADTWGLIAGVSWRLRPGLTLGPGIGVFERLEESTAVFPILVIDWDITERWNLSTGRGLAASQGPGLTLGYTLNDDWTLNLIGRYEQIDFRLDDEGPAPGGIGRDEVVPLVLGAEWAPNPGTRLGFFIGGEFGGELELADPFGEVIARTDYDTALIGGASFSFRF